MIISVNSTPFNNIFPKMASKPSIQVRTQPCHTVRVANWQTASMPLAATTEWLHYTTCSTRTLDAVESTAPSGRGVVSREMRNRATKCVAMAIWDHLTVDQKCQPLPMCGWHLLVTLVDPKGFKMFRLLAARLSNDWSDQWQSQCFIHNLILKITLY